MLRFLHEEYGTSALARRITRCPLPKPRNVTVTADERARLLSAAPPNLRCFILMCSDLAMRSGTAARIGPENYDAKRGALSFVTKYGNTQVVGVTAELRALLDTCHQPNVPFVAQLPRGLHPGLGYTLRQTGHLSPAQIGRAFQSLRRRCGIERRITPHDLRRTTARNVYAITGDIRDVQNVLGHNGLTSTVWYMQTAMGAVKSDLLELAKLPTITERPQ